MDDIKELRNKLLDIKLKINYNHTPRNAYDKQFVIDIQTKLQQILKKFDNNTLVKPNTVLSTNTYVEDKPIENIKPVEEKPKTSILLNVLKPQTITLKNYTNISKKFKINRLFN